MCVVVEILDIEAITAESEDFAPGGLWGDLRPNVSPRYCRRNRGGSDSDISTIKEFLL